MYGPAWIPLAQAPQTRKDYISNQEACWCPGCDNYVILSTFQVMMADLGIARENTVVVSGIGCSSRFPYYADCYGMHSIHGRAAATVIGVAVAHEDLNVWAITGDGDVLSIGGNHLIHAMRCNVNINILLFNNRIYGLAKGQYSLTSEQGKLTKSTPYGFLDVPFNPVALVLGAEASSAARAVNSDRVQLTEVMNAAARHRGVAPIEIYQDCSIFNNEAFDALKGLESANVLIRLRDGESVIFGTEEQFRMVREPSGGLRVTETATATPERIVVYDVGRRDSSQAPALAQLIDHGVMHCTLVGILRWVECPAYDDLLRAQVAEACAENPHDALQAVMSGETFWEIT